MNEDQIRDIVRNELQQQGSGGRFGMGGVQKHTHNGLDSPKVNAGNLIPGLKTTGEVEFATEGRDYKFNVNFTPHLVTLYGIATRTSVGLRSVVVGQAALGQNLYFQPDSPHAVTVGGKLEIVQSYAQLLINNAGTARATADDQHILSVTDGSTIFARATVTSYGQNFFTIHVDTLASGWTINACYFVS